MGYNGLRPKLNSLKYNPRSADPVNPVEGEVQYADGTVRPEGLWVYKDSAWSQVGVGNTSEGYITGDSSNFEGTIGSWLAYADAAGASPVDGTGGSPASTFTRTTTAAEVLNGTASGKLSKSAADRQGEGVAIAVTTDNSLKNKPVELSFNFLASANFDYGAFLDSADPSDVSVWIYDVTNATLIQPYPYTLDPSGIYKGQFQASSSTSYRMILHIGTTNASAWDLSIDNVKFKAVDPSYIRSDSDWAAYTPTYVGMGTVSTSNMYYRKNGPNLEIHGSFLPGTTTAVPFTMTLPNGLLSSSTYTSTANDVVGQFGNLGGSPQVSALISQSSNLLGATVNGANNLTKQNGSAMFSSGLKVSVWASIRIDNWTSGFVTADSVLTNVPATFRAFKNAGSITANTTIPTWTTVSKDSVGSFNSTTGEYTVKIPGDYKYNFKIATTSGTPIASIYKNGTEVDKGLGSGVRSSVSGLLAGLVVGDIITARIDSTLTNISDNVSTSLDLEKIETPAASMNIRKIAIISDVKADATDGGTFTSGAWQTRTLNTEVDPFGIVSLSANQFVLQPGTYAIEGSAPAVIVNSHQTRLRNITAGTTSKVGSREFSSSSDITQNRSTFYTVLSITVATTFELQHRCGTTRATDGFGRSNADSFGEQVEYAQVKIEKLL